MSNRSNTACAPRLVGLLLSLSAGACTSTQPKADTDSQVKPGTLVFELPAGATVQLAGVSMPAVETQPRIELGRGTYDVIVTSTCGERSTAKIELSAGQNIVVDLEPPLKTATLALTVRTPKGVPQGLVVKLDDDPIEIARTVKVSACKKRMHISADDWGGYIEDIDFQAGEFVHRNIELAGGPDLVRIHGGEFIMGPPPENRTHWRDIAVHPEKVATFDLDKHEVTTAQFHACRVSGGCSTNIERTIMSKPPPRSRIESCTTDVYDALRKPRDGQSSLPMNCVAQWEAAEYCKWTRKRLPTEAEWEFAARSRKTEYVWPWGDQAKDCKVHHSPFGGSHFPPEECDQLEAPAPVCTHPLGNTEQGVCNMSGNLKEVVRRVRPKGDQKFGYKGGHWGRPLPTFYTVNWQGQAQSTTTGFRCARDVRLTTPPTSAQKRNGE